FEEFHRNYNYVILINSIADPRLIECQVCEYIAQMTKKDRGEYKAKSVQQAFPNLYDVVNKKIKDLQEKGLGKKEDSVALTAQQVKKILDDKFLDPNTPEGLLYQIQADNSILFCYYHSKNNQCGILGGSAQNIHLPPDLPGTSGPV
ncbi:4560_t:CDS:2, partial [Racocetra persica]